MTIKQPTFKALCSRQILNHAWNIVKAKNSQGGIDGKSIADFDNQHDVLIDTIQDELQTGTWKPFPYKKIQIPKNDGEKRSLGLLAVKDKVVQTAIKILIEPLLDSLFANNSYGYRPGRGHFKAIRRTLFECSQKDAQIVLRLDIDNYFDTVDHAILFTKLDEVLQDKELFRLIRLCVQMGRVNGRRQWESSEKGLPQGAVLSPLLANLYLNDFDKFINTSNNKYVRYADDFVVLCESKEEAESLLTTVTSYLSKNLRLTLNTPEIGTLDEGFEFLGISFKGPKGQNVSLASDKKEEALRRIGQMQITEKGLKERDQRAWESLGRYYKPIVGEEELKLLDSALIQRFETLIRTTHKSIPCKGTIAHGVSKIPFLSQEMETNRNEITSHILSLYAQYKESVLKEQGERQNAGIISQRKNEYRKMEGAGAELLVVSSFCTVGISAGNIIVRQKGATLSKRSSNVLRHITISGKGVSISSAAVHLCADKGIPIDFFDGPTHYGTFLSTRYANNKLWAKQSALSGEGRCDLARRLIEGKIKNQCNLMKYFHKYHKNQHADLAVKFQLTIAKMQKYCTALKAIGPTDDYAEKLMAVEAQAAGEYWGYVRTLLSDDAPDFEKREHQGAKDLVNAMLNYAYAILYSRVWQALLRVSLNPYDSVLHARQNGKPTLVYDIVEIFRAQGADRVVISLVQKGTLLKLKGGMLSEESKKILSSAVLERLNRYEKYRGRETRFEDIILLQAKEIAAHINDGETYKPYLAKW